MLNVFRRLFKLQLRTHTVCWYSLLSDASLVHTLRQGFFSLRPKNSYSSQKTQTQEFFRENSRIFFEKTQEMGKFWELFCLISQIYVVYVSDSTLKPRIIYILQFKLKEFLKTQWKLRDFSKTQGQNSPNFCKNSRFRKHHYPTQPKKRLKRNPGLCKT